MWPVPENLPGIAGDRKTVAPMREGWARYDTVPRADAVLLTETN
jgi:hypothetical protein